MDWFTEVELELLAVAEPVEIDADEDPDDDDELAELEPVDAIAIRCTAEVAESTRARRVSALENQDSRAEFTLATPELFGGQVPAGGAGDPGTLGGMVGVASGDTARGGLTGGVVLGLPI